MSDWRRSWTDWKRWQDYLAFQEHLDDLMEVIRGR